MLRLLVLRLPAVLLASGLIALAVVNTTPVRVHLPGLSAVIELPVYLVFLAGLILGVLLAALVSLPRRWVSWRRAPRAERRAAHLLRRGPDSPGPAADDGPGRSMAAIDHAQDTSSGGPLARR